MVFNEYTFSKHLLSPDCLINFVACTGDINMNKICHFPLKTQSSGGADL